MDFQHELHLISHDVDESDAPYRLPTDPSLWYNRSHRLLHEEQLAMAKTCPEALLGILQTSGALYWLVDVPFAGYPHKFMLFYRNSFPENRGSTPSVAVVPMIPDAATLRTELNEDCLPCFSREPVLNADCISLYPGTYTPPTAADYLNELNRWLAANQLR